MDTWNAILLGLIQGLTEFLPISSSGHLVLFQKLFHLQEGALMFNVLVHGGTLIAVLWVFWEQVLQIVKQPFGPLSRKVIAAAIPTAAIGILFEDQFEMLFASGSTLGIEFLLTGTILWWAETLPVGNKRIGEMSYMDSIWIGILQGAAILPAISRSGLTLSGSLWRGLDRKFAAEFSFLVSIPVILGALMLEGKKAIEAGEFHAVFSGTALLATAVAAVSGYLAIRYMLILLTNRSMRVFAWYTWILGGLILSDQLFFHFIFPSFY